MKVVSFCVFGDKPTYTVGAVKNAELVRTWYPEFYSRFYVGTSVPAQTIADLEEVPFTQVSIVEEPEDYRSTFWRFRAATDPDVTVMLSRDVDSRIDTREAAAVREWLESPYDFHIMRDHPWHDVHILAGLFGVRGEALRTLGKWAEIWYRNAGNHYQTDQSFLSAAIYPVIRHNAMVHDEYFHFEDELANRARPFPTERRGGEFVAEGYDENDNLLYPEHQYGRRV